MARKTVFLALTLLVGGVSGKQGYTGPRCLGPYCVDHDIPLRTLFKQLGPPAPRATQFFPYCYQSQDEKKFLYIDEIGEEPGAAGAVFLSDFPNCMHTGKRVTTEDLSAWKTPEGVGIGSSEDDVIRTYGKPPSESKIDAQDYRFAVRGYRPSDPKPNIGEKSLLYNDLTGDDLRAASFSIRNGKVSSIWLSNED